MSILKVFMSGTEFSWRKALTAIVAFVFAFVVIGYLFGLPEVPKTYQAIIAGVFTFYFGKDALKGIKLVNDKEPRERKHE